MRLTDNTSRRVLALGLIAALGACASGNGDVASLSPPDTPAAGQASTGPSGDYPIVLGEPYPIDGQLFTPVDTMSYDEVGYAASDAVGGGGITAAHKTLPLPSYVEVTSLETGKTILVRVERRGPMTSERLIALSPGAQAQLGAPDGTPVRVRRVNPPEVERSELRMGNSAPMRMETPQSLVTVLKRKLPVRGSVNLAKSAAEPAAAKADGFATAFAPPPKVKPPKSAEPQAAAPTGYALKPLAPLAKTDSSKAAPPKPVSATPASEKSGPKATGNFVVQAAAFASKDNAEKAASKLGGFVKQAGRYYRVRVGPFTSRGQADAALAKVRAAGYSDAKISTSG